MANKSVIATTRVLIAVDHTYGPWDVGASVACVMSSAKSAADGFADHVIKIMEKNNITAWVAENGSPVIRLKQDGAGEPDGSAHSTSRGRERGLCDDDESMEGA